MSDTDDMPQVPADGELPSAPPETEKRTRKAAGSGSSALPVFASLQTERAVIASLITDSACISTVGSILGGLSNQKAGKKKYASDPNELKRDMFHSMAQTIFYDQKYAAIYEAILELNSRGLDVDLLSLINFLEQEKKLDLIGGEPFLLDIASSIASTANIESWCITLRDYAMLREMLHACQSSVDMCKNSRGDVKVLLDSVESEIFKVRNRFVQPEIKQLSNLLDTTIEGFLQLIDNKKEPGIPTGFPDLDRLIGGGLKPGEMFVLAARPSIGKTAIALNIVRNIIMRDIAGVRKNVLFFSLEMSGVQVAQRLLCTEAKVPLSSIMDKSIRPQDVIRLTQTVAALKTTKLMVDETAGISVFELRAKARKINDREKLDLIVIDYLQLMKSGEAGSNESRQVEVASISGGLKKLAKDLQVPVLVLAQLNRESEKDQGNGKGDVLPKLSHLRESGAIEQDADEVVFLHRKRDESKDSNPEANRVGVDAKLIVEKNRNGKTGIVNLKFFPALMEFRSIDHRFSEQDLSPDEKPAGKKP